MRKLKKTNKKLKTSIRKRLAVLIPIATVCLASSCSMAKQREYEYSRRIFTSDGEYLESKQFKSFNPDNETNLTDSFISYGAWELNDEGNYQRNVKEYIVGEKTYEDIKGLENNDTKIEELFGEPAKTYIQESNNISKEDIDRGSYYEATLYSVNESSYVIVKNSNSTSPVILIGGLVGFMLVTAGLIALDKHEKKGDTKELKLKR